MNAKEFKFYGESCYGRSWQAQFADKIGVDRRRITQWIKNDKIPDFAVKEVSSILAERSNEIFIACEMINK